MGDNDGGESTISALAAVPWNGRAVLLVDLDAFFASVEQLDHPAWRGKPVIVGGESDRRGVVAAASYEARKYGVHSAMPSSTAERLCPEAIWTRGRFNRYREMSEKVMTILRDETPYVQQVSIDEAFLDVTPTSVNREHPALVAQRIQERVEELGVTCSIGVATTKSVAKIASDMDKPRGLTIVLPGSELNFMDPLPIRVMSGIGASAERKLEEIGIKTLGDLARADDDTIVGLLGKTGRTMLNRARGLESGVIENSDAALSISSEMSFAQDLTTREEIESALSVAADKVARRLRRKGLAGHTLILKVRYSDRSLHSSQRRLARQCDDEAVLIVELKDMLDALWQPGMALRLVGVAVSGFDNEEDPEQLSLFGEDEDDDSEMRRRLLATADRVKERFGEQILRYGREMRLGEYGTGTMSKNPADYK